MLQRIWPALAVSALAFLAVGPWAAATEPPTPTDEPVSSEIGAEIQAPKAEVPSLKSQLAELSVEPSRVSLSCQLAKCPPELWSLCPSDCVCRLVDCQVQCWPLPLRPDSCQYFGAPDPP